MEVQCEWCHRNKVCGRMSLWTGEESLACMEWICGACLVCYVLPRDVDTNAFRTVSYSNCEVLYINGVADRVNNY